MAEPVLEIGGLSKTFGGQRVLRDVSLTTLPGEVHALVGANGSGKSTLIKILSGFHAPDPSPNPRVRFKGEDVSLHSSGWRRQLRFVHQNLALVPTLSTTENLAIDRGFTTGKLGRIRWREERRRVRESVERLGLTFDPDLPVASLSRAEATAVAVVRAVDDWEENDGLLVLDEPTAALSVPEAEELFAIVRKLVANGVSVLFVSHRMEEIFGLAQGVTVLRDGQVVASRSLEGMSKDDLVTLMVGEHVDDLYRPPPEASSRVILKAEGISGVALQGLSFELRAGEILGIAGLRGSGREEVAPILFGASEAGSGTIRAGGSVHSLPIKPTTAIDLKMGFVPADRMTLGGISKMPVRENITLPLLGPLWRRGRLRRRLERAEVADWMSRVKLEPPMPERHFDLFSGGNQQKAVIAKWLRMKPEILLLDEPTQGVDIAATASIHALLADIAGSGTGIVVCSSELDELVHVCHRVLVLRNGRLSTEVAASRLSERSLLSAISSSETDGG
jgi:ribose transport system ATP-binding protein